MAAARLPIAKRHRELHPDGCPPGRRRILIQIQALPALRDNYIWLLSAGRQAVVVDPGEAAPVRAALAAHSLQLVAVLLTHHHADHCAGVAELAQDWPGLAVFAPGVEEIAGTTHPLSGGETLALLGASCSVLAVPGHTRGHLAYAWPGHLFCGDTLFGAGCGRLFEGTPAQMAASLASLAAFPDETLLYCAHEYTEANLRFAAVVEPDNPAVQRRMQQVALRRGQGLPTVPSTLAEEKASNPFLRCQVPAVCAAAQRREPGIATDAVTVFAAIRAWRNQF